MLSVVSAIGPWKPDEAYHATTIFPTSGLVKKKNGFRSFDPVSRRAPACPELLVGVEGPRRAASGGVPVQQRAGTSLPAHLRGVQKLPRQN